MDRIRILILEDNPSDAKLVEYNLNKDKLPFISKCVENEKNFKQALNEFRPDIILSDFNLPQYSGYAALEYVQRVTPEVPVIIVSGAIGEEKAVELLKKGAKDYVLKDRMVRLPDAVRRVLHESEETKRRIEIEMALHNSEQRYRLLVENSPMCIHEIDMNGRIISMNKAGLDMMGLKDESEVRGIPYLKTVHDDDKKRIEELLFGAFNGLTSQFEFTAAGSGDKIFKSCFVPIKNSVGVVEKLMGITEDITQRKKDEKNLLESESHFRQLADYDQLTSLPNRRLLHDRMQHAMVVSKRSGRYGALMFIDLDHFKPLNDKYGHNVGDLLLIEVARRITGCVREIDTVSRFGGDEFIVMLIELDANEITARKIAAVVSEKIRSKIAELYQLKYRRPNEEEIIIEHKCTSSIGVVMFVNHDNSPEEVLKWADIAMYQAKSDGRNMIRFFEPPVEPEKDQSHTPP